MCDTRMLHIRALEVDAFMKDECASVTSTANSAASTLKGEAERGRVDAGDTTEQANASWYNVAT